MPTALPAARSRSRARRPGAWLGCLALLCAAGAAAQPEPDPLDRRIDALERALAQDEATLARLISDPATASRLHESGEFVAIAERMPRLQGELRRLRAQRERDSAPDDD